MLDFMYGRSGGGAHKPDWVELEVLWTSSRTVELSGIYGFRSIMRLVGLVGVDVRVLQSRRRNRRWLRV